MRSAKLGSVIALAAFTVYAPMNAHAKGEFKDAFKAASTVKGAPRNTRPVPTSWRDAHNDAQSRAGTAMGTAWRATKTIAKTKGRFLLTAGGVAAVVALAAADISYTANAPEVLTHGLNFANDVGTEVVEAAKTLLQAAPTVGAVAGVAGAGYVAMPYVKYIGKGIARVWYDGGPGVDIGVGSLHFLLGALATGDISHGLQAGGAATFISNGARWLTPGASKLGPRMKDTERLR